MPEQIWAGFWFTAGAAIVIGLLLLAHVSVQLLLAGAKALHERWVDARLEHEFLNRPKDRMPVWQQREQDKRRAARGLPPLPAPEGTVKA